MDFPNRVLRVEILNPAYLINADLAFENTFGVNVAVLYCALLIVVLAMIYAIYRWISGVYDYSHVYIAVLFLLRLQYFTAPYIYRMG